MTAQRTGMAARRRLARRRRSPARSLAGRLRLHRDPRGRGSPTPGHRGRTWGGHGRHEGRGRRRGASMSTSRSRTRPAAWSAMQAAGPARRPLTAATARRPTAPPSSSAPAGHPLRRASRSAATPAAAQRSRRRSSCRSTAPVRRRPPARSCRSTTATSRATSTTTRRPRPRTRSSRSTSTRSRRTSPIPSPTTIDGVIDRPIPRSTRSTTCTLTLASVDPDGRRPRVRLADGQPHRLPDLRPHRHPAGHRLRRRHLRVLREPPPRRHADHPGRRFGRRGRPRSPSRRTSPGSTCS